MLHHGRKCYIKVENVTEVENASRKCNIKVENAIKVESAALR